MAEVLPANRGLRILHLEDDPTDGDLIRLHLEADVSLAELLRVDTAAGFETGLQSGQFDLILSDYSVPGFDGPAALALARRLAPDLPFIIVSGALDEETAVSLVRGGATDYVLKSRLRRLAPAIHQAMREARERQARRAAEQLLNRQVEQMAVLAEAAQAFAEAGPDYRAVVNIVVRRVAELLGDGCTLRLLSEDDQWLPVAADWHRNVGTLAFLRELAVRPMRADDEGLASQVWRSGHSKLIPVVSPTDLPTLIAEPWRPYWEQKGAHSLVAVPLRSRGRVIGVLVATRDETPQPYTDDDRHLLRGLADRAALVIENARLYQAAQSAWGAAEVTVERAERLQKVTALLAAALTPDQVGNIIVKDGAAVLGTSAASLQLLAPNGETLHVVNVSGLSLAELDQRRVLPLNDPTPSAEVMRTGRAVWFASQAEVVRRYPRMAATRLLTGYEALAVLPMTVESRPIGTLAINFPQARAFSVEEQAFMLTLAGLCAQALERARLYAAEAAARSNAEQAVERTARLQAVTAALASAVSPPEVAAVIVAQSMAAMGANGGAVSMVTPDGEWLERLQTLGYSEAIQQYARLPVSGAAPTPDAVRTRQPLWLESHAEFLARYPQWGEVAQAFGIQATAVVPLLVDSEAVGALALIFSTPRAFSLGDQDFLLSIGQQCAQALERARLYAEAQALNAALEGRVRERTEQLRAITARLESLREDERARIAREVHDELGGAMTAIKMDLSRLARRAGQPGSELPEALAGTIQLIDDTIQTVRRIATDLRPALLDDFGLVAALEWQAQEFARRTGLQCDLEFEAQEVALEKPVATALFRVFQETLTNIARHADATRVSVRLARQPDGLVLTLRDNGRGFKVADLARSPSLGVAGMRERVFSIAGELDIQSTPGEGTTVTVRLPIPP